MENVLTEDSSVGGDLGGTYHAPRVERLQGNAVAAEAPQEGQVLTWVGGRWMPVTPANPSILAGTLRFETEHGHSLELSDSEAGIALSDAHGNRLVFGANGIRLESSADLVLMANGKLRIEALNVAIEASSAVTVAGSSGATLTSSAVTAVKGSLVKIN